MKINSRTLSLLFSIPIIAFLAIISGGSSQGPDYQNYIWIIDRVVKADVFLDKILVSKDIMFGIITWIISPQHRDEYFLVILSVVCLSSISKVFISYKLGLSFFVYIVLYTLLMAPGLEYAAIRSLLGLSAIVIYLCIDRFKWFFIVFSVLSHLSFIPMWLLLSDFFQRLVNLYSRWAIGLVIFIGSMVLVRFLDYIPQTETYIDLAGSWLLFFRVALVLICLYFLSVEHLRLCGNVRNFTQRLLDFSLFISFVSLGAIDVSVASNRFHEMSCYLSLIAIFSIDKKIMVKRNILIYTSALFISICASTIYRNTSSNLWVVYSNFEMDNLVAYFGL